MKVGFTGTRQGMTEAQKISLHQLLLDLGATSLHHGDCLGADAEAHTVAQELGLYIVIHPPKDGIHRALCQGAHETREPKTYFARNRAISDETDCLIGASVTDHPLPNGGTWYTIDYNADTKEPYVIWPNGTVSRLPRRR